MKPKPLSGSNLQRENQVNWHAISSYMIWTRVEVHCQLGCYWHSITRLLEDRGVQFYSCQWFISIPLKITCTQKRVRNGPQERTGFFLTRFKSRCYRSTGGSTLHLCTFSPKHLISSNLYLSENNPNLSNNSKFDKSRAISAEDNNP